MNNNQIITVDAQTGEIMSIVNSMKVPIGKEPAFYKSYLEDAACLTGLTLAEVMLFRWMCMNMNYSNSIFIMKPQREEISKLYGYNKSTIDMSVTKLAKKGLIIRQSRGCYIVNPNLAAKGSWEDVKALRVTIDYMEQGRQVRVSKIDNKQLQVEELR